MLSRIANSVKCNYNCDVCVCVCVHAHKHVCVCSFVSYCIMYATIFINTSSAHVHACKHLLPLPITKIYIQGKCPTTNILLKLKMTNISHLYHMAWTFAISPVSV